MNEVLSWILSTKDAPEYKIERTESDFDDMSSEILNKVRSLKMDLLAYMQIDTLKFLLDENGIDIPRLRGIESMRIANSISKGWIDEVIKDTFYTHFLNLEEDQGHYSSKYVDGENVLWNKLHGKRRSRAKLLLKHVKRDVNAWANAYNKYVGREDVLRVYTRIGGDNWLYYKGDKLKKEPWFLEKVDDYFDSTYCDIYVRIKEINKEHGQTD